MLQFAQKKYFLLKNAGPYGGCGVSMLFFLATKKIYLLLGIALIAWNSSCIGHEFCYIISATSIHQLLCLFCLILTSLQWFITMQCSAFLIAISKGAFMVRQINALFGLCSLGCVIMDLWGLWANS